MIPEVEGIAFSIEDDNMTKKCEALHHILKELEKTLPPGKVLTVILLIPEGKELVLKLGVVSYLIGSHGRQINSIMSETGTDIIVNQPIFRFPPRTVKLSGYS